MLVFVRFVPENFFDANIINVVVFLLGDSSASEFYVPTFRNSSMFIGGVGAYTAYEDGTVCSETSAYKIQTPGNHPKERKQYS